MIDRRSFLASAAAAFAAACARPLPGDAASPAGRRDETASDQFEAIRGTLGAGGRIGVAAIDTGSGRRLVHDADSRYAMASTFKLPLAAFALAEVEAGRLRLDEELAFASEDPLSNSPVVEANLARRSLPVERLAASIVERSDNSAANMLLRRLGGPAALTRFLRASGDIVTRLDRMEMELNSNLSGDPRDTTSPAAMAETTRRLVLGDRLGPASRARLVRWMTDSVPGRDRLRAGLPADWRWGHKTGTGARGSVNDVGIAWPPGRAPIVIACYQDGGTVPTAIHAAAHAAVARLVVETFA
ncbi:MAG TPA: class A beta-lactamase [Allosphingosinicella sp.]|jgi:beta-lactamase class A